MTNTERQVRNLQSLTSALLDGLVADTRAISTCMATLENLQRARPSEWTTASLRDCQRVIAELAARYRPNT